MLDFSLKVIKKLKIGNLFFYCLKPFHYKKIEVTNNVDKAQACLEEFHPKILNSSCFNNSITQTDLDLSIIIPVYNVENYIDECLSSVLNQETEFKFNIIVVDDGSTDNSSKILEKYKNNSKIKLISQENKGIAGARNTALKEISSNYVTFLDSDDRLSPGSIQALMKTAYTHNSDIVEGGYFSFNNKLTLNKFAHSEKFNTTIENKKLYGYPWGRIIRSSFFKNVHFPEKTWYEDTIFTYLIFPQTNKISTIRKNVYEYRRHSGSTSIIALTNKKCLDTYWIMEQMLLDMKKLNIEKNQTTYENTLEQIKLNYIRTKNMPSKIQKSIFILSINLLQKEFANFSTQHSKLKHFEAALKNNDYGTYCLFANLI